jgi:hypothetical protein
MACFTICAERRFLHNFREAEATSGSKMPAVDLVLENK